MIFNVMVRSGYNADGKQIVNVYQVHENALSQYVRNVQDAEHYIISVRSLKVTEKEDAIDEPIIRFKKDIDPRLIKKEFTPHELHRDLENDLTDLTDWDGF